MTTGRVSDVLNSSSDSLMGLRVSCPFTRSKIGYNSAITTFTMIKFTK